MNREYLKSRCFEDEDENWWERRTGMERCMFVFLIISISLSIGCVTFISLRYLLSEEFCNSAACLSEALKLSLQINDSVDPCEDFFKYSCNMISEVPDFEQRIKDEINLLLQESIKEDDYYAVKQEKKLFLACTTETDEKNSVDVITKMLDEIGGWPVVVGYRWRARVFEWTDAVYVLRNRGFPFSIFFSITTTENKILISKPTEIHLGYNRDLYRNFMTDTAVAFGADRYQAQLQMEDVLMFAEELRNITKDKFEAKDKTEDLFSTQLTIEELQKIYDEIRWLDFFNNIFYPVLTVNSTNTVVIPSHEYLGTIFDLLGATTKRVQANYLVWKVIETMIPFIMNKQLQNLNANYTCQTGENVNTDRKYVCANFLESIYFVRPLELVYLNSTHSPEITKKVEELLGNIKDELIMTIENLEIDENTIKNIKIFLRAARDEIGVPEYIFNQTLFETGATNNEENTFKIILEAQKNYIDITLALNNQTKVANFLSLIKTADIFYSKEFNAIVIPNVFVREYYNVDQPMYLNYASVGTVYANVLLQMLWDNFEDLRFNSTILALMEQSTCQKIDEELVTHKLSINLVHRAYTGWVERNVKEPKLFGLSQSPTQLLWIASFSKNCADFQYVDATEMFLSDSNFVNDLKCSNSFTYSDNCNDDDDA